MRLFVNSGPPSPFCGCKNAHPLPNPYASTGLAHALEKAWFLLPETDKNLDEDEGKDARIGSSYGMKKLSETSKIYRNSVTRTTAPFGGDVEADEEAVRCSMDVGCCEELGGVSGGKVSERRRVNGGGGGGSGCVMLGNYAGQMEESGRRRYVFGSLDIDVGRCNSPDTNASASPTVTATFASMCNTPCTAVSSLPTTSDAEDASKNEAPCSEGIDIEKCSKLSGKRRTIEEQNSEIEFPSLPTKMKSQDIEHIRGAYEAERLDVKLNVDAVEDAVHGVYHETVGPLLAIDLSNVGELGFDTLKLQARFERAVALALMTQDNNNTVEFEKALRAGLRRVALASVRELWKEVRSIK